MSEHDVVIVGAGWAGLSAAVHLAEKGLRPMLLDAAPQPGGRARGLTLELAGLRCPLDNGQHLIIGAYTETLSLIERVAAGEPAIRRAAMRVDAVDGMRIRPAAWPPPFDLLGGLLRAQGLSRRERWALLRALAGLRWRGWRVRAGQTVAGWLAESGQPASLVDRFWLPLCIATMNTAPEAACAQTFANVLRDSLGASARACEFVLPTRSLDEVLPQPACDWLLARGVPLVLRHAVRAVRRDPAGGSWLVEREPAADPAGA
ncbi:MAG: FAD-dependent oxidoreductase, partial [Burkholderiaceae bacterium]